MRLRLRLCRVAAALGAACLVVAGSSCGVLIGLEDHSLEERGDASRDEAAQDAGASDGAAAGVCPGRGGPAPVLVGVGAARFCIDATEVTNDQYKVFVEALVGMDSKTLLPASGVCAGESFLPPSSSIWPPAPDAGLQPVREVDWCAAYAFCKWAGKRLCGRVGGGEAPYNDGMSLQSELYVACSAGGTRLYPDGKTWGATACGGSPDASGPKNVTASGCEGSVPGVFDLTGNVMEWEDGCDPASDAASPRDVSCNRRGGNWAATDPSELSCRGLDPGGRAYTSEWTGIRCCGDAR